MRNIARTVAVSLTLTLAPAMRASGEERRAPTTSRAENRRAAVTGPEIELQALDDTLQYSLRNIARPGESSPDVAARSGSRRARSSAEAELDALALNPLDAPAGHAPAYASGSWSDGGSRGVPAAEAELHALLAWQNSPSGAASMAVVPVERRDALARSAPASAGR